MCVIIWIPVLQSDANLKKLFLRSFIWWVAESDNQGKIMQNDLYLCIVWIANVVILFTFNREEKLHPFCC